MSSGSGAASMRFGLHEVLSGMLASIESDRFTDDPRRLAAMFEQLAGRFPLFAPLSAGVDPAAVSQALQTLENKNLIQHSTGCYVLPPEGRASCVSSKRTLFSRRDSDQLEEAALVFGAI